MAQANESTAKVCDFAMHETTRIGPICRFITSINSNPQNLPVSREPRRNYMSFVCVSRVCEDMPAAVVRFRSLPDDEWLWVFVLLLLALVVNKREK